MRVSGENIKTEGKDIVFSYDDFGPAYAPTVIFIHGFPFNKSMWNLQTELLRSNYRVIAYDVRGHGGSVSKRQDFSIDLFADDLVELMDLLKIEKAMLCGLSMGGYIALRALEKYPDRFNAIVLSGTQCIADTEKIREDRLALVERLRSEGLEKYADESLKKLFATTSFTSRKEEVRSVRKMITDNSVETLCSTLMALAARKETCSRLNEIDIPALILVGKEDKITPPVEAEALHFNIRGSELHKIEYAAHLANLENTHEFNEQLRLFIEKVCKVQNLSRHCVEQRE
ncbi:MAG: 3-oxoadipate enol-lactonase [Bacteroidetes bacterium]|jgi:pimeloyl-ACP methyl ester carboxylesterase|nr:3-oxoadipate enol-lactonase [Bacteroidota bacterium]